MLRVRRLRAAAAIACIGAVTATGTAHAVDGGPADQSWLPDIRESSTLDGPPLIEGTLVDRRNEPIEGRVVVVAWPRQSTLASIKEGESVRLLPVAKASVSRDGKFVVRLDDSAPIEQVTEPDGMVNFDIYATTADGLSAYSFPRRHDGDKAWFDPGIAFGGEAQRGAAVELATLGNRPAYVLEGAIPAPLPVDKNYCEAVLRATYDNRLGLVGEVYTGPNAKGDFQYINGSSSNLGVGFSATGAYGSSWSVSGSVSRNSTVTIDYPTQSQNAKKVFQTSFRYKKWENRCIGANGGWETISFQTRADSFQGASASYNAASAPAGSLCQNQLAGAVITKETGTAQNFSNGAKLGSVIGVDLSAQTGFDEKAKIKFTFVTAGKLCGVNGLAYPSAPSVVGQ